MSGPPVPAELPRLIPTGQCWCGCGREATIGAFFYRGHDKKAEADLVAIYYGGSVAQLIYAHGYGPGRSLHDHALELGVKIRCPVEGCRVSGIPAGIRSHVQRDHGLKWHGCHAMGCPGGFLWDPAKASEGDTAECGPIDALNPEPWIGPKTVHRWNGDRWQISIDNSS